MKDSKKPIKFTKQPIKIGVHYLPRKKKKRGLKLLSKIINTVYLMENKHYKSVHDESYSGGVMQLRTDLNYKYKNGINYEKR